MGIARTFILISGLIALFTFIGFAIGGESGAIMAFGIAFLMNFFAYFNSDKIVLKMYKAKEADYKCDDDEGKHDARPDESIKPDTEVENLINSLPVFIVRT